MQGNCLSNLEVTILQFSNQVNYILNLDVIDDVKIIGEYGLNVNLGTPSQELVLLLDSLNSVPWY